MARSPGQWASLKGQPHTQCADPGWQGSPTGVLEQPHATTRPQMFPKEGPGLRSAENCCKSKWPCQRLAPRPWRPSSLAPWPGGDPASLPQENEELCTKVQQLEAALQRKVEELMGLEVQMDRLQWRKEEEVRHLDERLRGLQLSLEAQKSQPPEVQVSAAAAPLLGTRGQAPLP